MTSSIAPAISAGVISGLPASGVEGVKASTSGIGLASVPASGASGVPTVVYRFCHIQIC